MNSAFLQNVQYHWKAAHPADTRTLLLYLFASATLILNLLDAILTLGAVNAGLAVEANPLMANLLDSSPVGFVLTKTTLVSLGLILLWRHRGRGMAAAGIVGSALLYGGIVAYHVNALAL
jgi:hypothetical protein